MMKYIDEYRDDEQVQRLIEAIRETVMRPWRIMEICGGQTHSIVRYGIDKLLPEKIVLLHGPGCPVCVTPACMIDRAIAIAKRPNSILASFGDMMRVPGSRFDLLRAKAEGADVRILYSTLDALDLAEKNPEKEVVFFAVGFETTVPLHLTAIKEAERRRLGNFSVITSLFTVPAAIHAILSEKDCKVDGFLAAGHVCAVTGFQEYHLLAKKFKKPLVITGFEPVDLLYGIYCCVAQLEQGNAEVQNAYKRIVTEEGNRSMRELMQEMLEPVDQDWRGIGEIAGSGLRLTGKYAKYDSSNRFPELLAERSESAALHTPCIAGDIMRGNKQVEDCPFFGTQCTPEHPVGAPMVSAEGVCATWHRYS